MEVQVSVSYCGIIYINGYTSIPKSINKVSFPTERLTTYHFMDEENEEQEVVEETLPEEETTEEESDVQEETQEPQNDSVSMSKSEYTKLKRKAIAYDSGKQTTKVREEPLEKNDRFERLELRTEGYSPEEVDEIMSLGGPQVLESKLVQSAIKAMRAEKKSMNAKEPLNSKSPVYKKFTQDDLSKMSSKEMEKILQE